MSQIKVTYKRHLAKTITYRILSTSIGFLAMWWASGSIKVGAAFGVVELIYKPLQYYIHERIWYKYIKFGLSDDKKKRQNIITEVKLKTQLKANENNSPKTEPIPSGNPSSAKKVLNYSSNR